MFENLSLGMQIFICQILWICVVIIIPLIPSILIYKIFPDTQVGANGILGNLKINTTGAFAAYLIILVFIISFGSGVNEHLRNISKQSYDFDTRVLFFGKDGKRITGKRAESLLTNLAIGISPDYKHKKGDYLRFPISKVERGTVISFYTKGFTTNTKAHKDFEKFIKKSKSSISIDTIHLYEQIAEYEPPRDPVKGTTGTIKPNTTGAGGPQTIGQTQDP